MQVNEKRVVIDSTFFSPEREVRRSKGLHLSHVIDFIESGSRAAKQQGDRGKDSLHNYAGCGFLWERVLEKVIHLPPEELFEWVFTQALFEVPKHPRVIRPGEQRIPICKCDKCAGDGKDCEWCGGGGTIYLYCTPDGYNIDQECLEEWKYTNKSARNPITGPKFSRWIQYQIPTYLKVLGLTECRLRVYFARGDYTTGEPIWMEFYLVYTPEEIEEAWQMIRTNAEYMIKEGLIA